MPEAPPNIDADSQPASPQDADDAKEPSARDGGAPVPARSRLGVLRHRHFRNVWIAAFFSWVGTWMENLGVTWAMAEATLAPAWKDRGLPSAEIMMAWHASAQMAPMLILGLVGGVVADRVNRKKLLLYTQVLLMGTAATLAVASWLEALTPPMLLIVGFAYGCIVAFNIPAWQVLTPRLVPRGELSSAITLNGMTFNLARAIGPAVAGLLMAQWGATVLFAVNTVSFVGVIVAAATTPDSPAPERGVTSPWQDLREAFTYAMTHTGTRVLILALSATAMLSTPMLRLLPILVPEVYHAQERAYGTLLATMGIGAVLGGAALRLVPWWYPRHHLAPLSIALGGLSLVLFGVCQSLWMALAAMLFVGAFWMWSFNVSISALQLLVTDRLRGRVLAICNVVSFGAMPVGSFIAGWVTQVAEPLVGHGEATQWGVIVPAACMLLLGVGMLIWRTPEIDGLASGDAGYDRRPGLLRGITAAAHRPNARRVS